MIDASARELHFLEHLAPVLAELPAELRGTVFVGSPAVAERALELELGPVEVGWPNRVNKRRRAPRPDPVLVASWGDLRVCERTRRPVVLFEHGAGQGYGNRSSSYIGGSGRERVDLFLVPNEAAARRNRRFYPSKRNVVIGSPRVDELRKIARRPGPLTAAISFHWRCEAAPEANTALDHYAGVLGPLRLELERAGVALIGHGHPRALEELGPLYRRAGIELVVDFAEVVARADLYAVDNSSTLFEFAALGRPVVVLNGPGYRREVEHGLRFWSEADVGLQVDEPADLAAGVLTALDDPVELARSREAAVARVYPFADGTSARRAAQAILAIVNTGRRCPVCGAAHASCGPPSNVVPIDVPREAPRSERVKEPKHRYPNPDRPGTFIKATETTARKLGLIGPPADVPSLVSSSSAGLGPQSAVEAAEPAPGADTPPGPPAPRTDAVTGESLPEGAISRGGVTSRARTKARSSPETPAPAPDAPPDAEPEPKDKARPAPSRRRRKVKE